MELTNWKTAYKIESFGHKPVHTHGIEIRIAINRPLNDKDEMAMYKIADDITTAIMSESMRLDPEQAEAKEAERAELVGLFGHTAVLVEEIPNGYCSRWCCTQKPWYVVTTPKGRITLGWRKRVIEIAWEARVNAAAEELFPGEDVTKIDRMIHAYGYEKAKEYIARLLL
jgi:hypothetical protein